MDHADAHYTDTYFLYTINNANSPLSCSGTVPFVPPKKMRLPKATVAASVATMPVQGQPDQVEITLTTDATALYVVLTTSAQGRFSDSMLTIMPGTPKIVTFVSWDGPLNNTGIAFMKSTLRVEHLADNL